MRDKRLNSWKVSFWVLMIAFVFLQGCSTIPKEASELSVQLGNRVSAIEDANLNLLHKYFDEKRSRVDEFIIEKWVPDFAKEFFSDPKMEGVWNEIVSSGNKKDRLEFIVRLGPKLQAKINSKRFELIKPLDDAERLIERTLREEYQQAKAINNTLTSFLVSAVKVDENRQRYLDMVGVTDHKIADIINTVDSGISTLVDRARVIPDKEEQARKYLEQIKSVVEKIKK